MAKGNRGVDMIPSRWTIIKHALSQKVIAYYYTHRAGYCLHACNMYMMPVFFPKECIKEQRA